MVLAQQRGESESLTWPEAARHHLTFWERCPFQIPKDRLGFGCRHELISDP
jgi:hypothetical protein